MKRALLFGAVALATCAWSRSSAAWYFPEHVVIAKDAVDQLAPDVRETLRAAVARARADGLPLCAPIDVGIEELSATTPVYTRMVRAPLGVDCVPFAALGALAGDHADGTNELRAALVGSKGRELTTAAAYEWRRFLEQVDRAPKAPVERMSFVHELDVDFYFIDPGYELRAQRTRSHFVDAGRPLDEVVRNAGVAGAVDNAVGQFVVHHLRSLELASRKYVTEALLEHAFAVHFLEDAFSSGHLVMTDRRWADGNTLARSRHDFFDARGLRVTRATSAEPCSVLETSFEAGLPPCWTTFGDGYLGIARDSSDRVHVVRAVRKAQLELAFALDPPRVTKFFDALGEREKISFGDYLDPAPWWTLRRNVRRTRPATAAYAERLVRGIVTAIDRLREGTPMPMVVIGRPTAGALFSASIIATSAEPCIDDVAETAGEPDDVCGQGRSLALGTVGASLLRPMLVELPAAQDDVAKLEGAAELDHGIAFQLLASASTGALFPKAAPVDLYVPGLGVSLGIAYRFGTYLPGRRNRSAVELNAGVSTALHYDARGRAGGHPQVTMLEQEIRWPILWEGLTSYVRPLDLRKSHQAGSIIVFGGARVREVLTDPAPRLWGIEAELIAVALSNGRGAYPLYSVSPELRFHFGFADPSVVQPSLAGVWGPTVSLTLAGGYATFF